MAVAVAVAVAVAAEEEEEEVVAVVSQLQKKYYTETIQPRDSHPVIVDEGETQSTITHRN